MNKKLMHTCAICLIAALAACAATAMAQDGGRVVDSVVYEQRFYSDGHSETVRLLWNPTLREFVEATQGARTNPAMENFDPALVQRADTWRSNTKKITFDFTPMAMPHRKDLKKIMNKYCNRRRGTKSVPKFKAGKTEVAVKSLASFGNNLSQYQLQFHDDDIHIICMTDDDLFFKNQAGQLLQPNVIAFTRTLSKARIIKNGGKWVGTYWIEEADVYLRSDFFQQSTYAQRLLIAGTLRFALGYKKPIWPLDLNADTRNFSEGMFEDSGSALWKNSVEMWDKMFYTDKLVGVSAKKKGYLDKAQALPADGAVLDVAGYKAPISDADGADVVFFTNLKAFAGKKGFEAEFKIILPLADGHEEVNLFTLTGTRYRYPGQVNVNGTPTNWYPTIFLNSVKLGQQSDLTALNNAIQQYGYPQTLNGVSYSKAIQVEVTMEGYLEENGKTKKLKRTYYFVNTDN